MGIPVACAFGIKESDDSMKQLLQYIKDDTYKWKIVIALLFGMQLGYTKFPCFLCEWDSRGKARHYSSLEAGHKNVKRLSQVE